MDLRVIDLIKDSSFGCGGRKFYKKDSLSFNRYRQLQFIMLEFGYSATFQDIFANLELAFADLNKLKLGEAAIRIHNIMNGVTKLEDKDDPALRICALFLDEADEDPAVFDEARMKDKINCWGKELHIKPFFYFASSLVPDWMPAYEMLIKSGLIQESEKSKE